MVLSKSVSAADRDVATLFGRCRRQFCVSPGSATVTGVDLESDRGIVGFLSLASRDAGCHANPPSRV
jgi:hypothetical protein